VSEKKLSTYEKVRRLRGEELKLCKESPEYFVFNLCKTSDPHDTKHPIKKFPDKEYLHTVLKIVHAEPKVIIPKSRQMMISWLLCAYCLWRALFLKAQLIFIQTLKEGEADKLVKRCLEMYRRLPSWMKAVYPKKSAYCRLEIPKTNSVIQGIPQGADIIRGNVSSFLFFDEAAFQPEFALAYQAAMPAVEGGGKVAIVSTPNHKNFFEALVNDRPADAQR